MTTEEFERASLQMARIGSSHLSMRQTKGTIEGRGQADSTNHNQLPDSYLLSPYSNAHVVCLLMEGRNQWIYSLGQVRRSGLTNDNKNKDTSRLYNSKAKYLDRQDMIFDCHTPGTIPILLLGSFEIKAPMLQASTLLSIRFRRSPTTNAPELD